MITLKSMASDNDRKQEVQEKCLEVFVEKGLSETSVRDLCKVIGTSSSGLYYYFNSRDEAVIACAEIAALRVEREVISKAIDDIQDPSRFVKNLQKRAKKYKKMYSFFLSVRALEKYEDDLMPLMFKLSEVRRRNAEVIARKLDCPPEYVLPYVYITISATESFMIWGKNDQIEIELEFVHSQMRKFKETNYNL